jgi:hypothetical protein
MYVTVVVPGIGGSVLAAARVSLAQLTVQTRASRAPRLQDRCKFSPMTARGRFVARLVTMLIALAGFVTVGALPAAAGNSGTVQYVALAIPMPPDRAGAITSTIACRA